jgi:hypothetical protein
VRATIPDEVPARPTTIGSRRMSVRNDRRLNNAAMSGQNAGPPDASMTAREPLIAHLDMDAF